MTKPPQEGADGERRDDPSWPLRSRLELELDDADSVFVYNAMIGVLVPITEVASASIGYRYIAAEGTDNIGGIINDVSQDIESEFDAHEISLGLRFHF